MNSPVWTHHAHPVLLPSLPRLCARWGDEEVFVEMPKSEFDALRVQYGDYVTWLTCKAVATGNLNLSEEFEKIRV